MESFSSEMRRVPTCIELLGHDTDANILKSKMLLWENTGQGDFSDLDNVLINDYNDKGDTLGTACLNTVKEIRKEILSVVDSGKIIKDFNAKLSNKRN